MISATNTPPIWEASVAAVATGVTTALTVFNPQEPSVTIPKLNESQLVPISPPTCLTRHIHDFFKRFENIESFQEEDIRAMGLENFRKKGIGLGTEAPFNNESSTMVQTLQESFSLSDLRIVLGFSDLECRTQDDRAFLACLSTMGTQEAFVMRFLEVCNRITSGDFLEEIVSAQELHIHNAGPSNYTHLVKQVVSLSQQS